MKKQGLFLSTICFLFMVSCCGNQQAQKEGVACDKEKKECCDKERKCCKEKCSMTEEQKAECKAFAEKWGNFDNLTPEEQQELIAKKKACAEAKREAMKAKVAACEAKWENFDNLTIAEQKEFLDNLCCSKSKKCCKKKCEKKAESCPSKEAQEEVK